jgi:hypothetical protein
MGIRVPEGAYFHLLGSGDLKIESSSKLGYAIGGDCDSSYGCISLESTGRLEIVCNSDRSIAIGGGSNPDDSEIRLISGEISISAGSPNALGIGCSDGNALIYAEKGCELNLEVNGITSVGIGSLTGYAHIQCESAVKFSGGGSKVVAVGVLNKGEGEIDISDTKLKIYIRTNFGTGIGTIGGNVNVTVTDCRIEINAEGGEFTGIGDAKGSGNVTLDHTELKAYILAGKPHEAGTKTGQFIMKSSSIIADINDKHNTQETGE